MLKIEFVCRLAGAAVAVLLIDALAFAAGRVAHRRGY